jgi:tetratricopeptide (TPR) repeat protein
LQPGLVPAQRALAEVAATQRDFDQLRKSSEEMIKAKPGAPDGYIFRALLEANSQPESAAEADLNKAIRVAPQDPFAYTKMAEWRVRQKRYAEAEKLYEEALTRDPNYADALRGLLSEYEVEKQPTKILKRLQEQIARVPKNADYYVLLAKV